MTSKKTDVELRSESSLPERIDTNILFKFIKPFDGSRDKLCSFINNCDNAFKIASASQKPILLDFILCQLEGKAESAASIKDFDSWEQLSTFLQSQFGERKHYAHLLSELQESQQQTNEPISTYALRIETTLSKLLTEITLSNKKKTELSGKTSAMEDLALHSFLMGLSPKISNFVRMKNPSNLNEAINLAISEEKIQTLLDQRASRNNRAPAKHFPPREDRRPIHALNKPQAPVCRYCKFLGHTIENCKKREYNNRKFNRNNFNSQRRTYQPANQNRPYEPLNRNYLERVHFQNDDENDNNAYHVNIENQQTDENLNEQRAHNGAV